MICLITLVLCLILEYRVSQEYLHKGFYINLMMGVFASSLLAVIVSLAQYFRYKAEHFFMINAIMGSIQMCMSSSLLSAKTYITSNIKRFDKAHDDQKELVMHLNDYHTFFCKGFKYRQIKAIHNLTLNSNFVFWTEFDNASNEEEYLASFRYANEKYKTIEHEYSQIIKSWNDYTDLALRSRWKKSLG